MVQNLFFLFGGKPSLVIAQPSSIVVFFSVEILEAIETIFSNFYEACAEKVGQLKKGRIGEDLKSTVLRIPIPSREYASFIIACNQIFLY